MKRMVKAVVFWLTILVSAFLLWQVVRTNPTDQKSAEISYSRFLSQIADGEISKVTISGQQVRGYDTKGGRFRLIAPREQSTMLAALQQQGVEIWFSDVAEGNWPTWILNLAPLIMLAALWFFMIRQMQKRSGRSVSAQAPSTDSQLNQPRFGP